MLERAVCCLCGPGTPGLTESTSHCVSLVKRGRVGAPNPLRPQTQALIISGLGSLKGKPQALEGYDSYCEGIAFDT